MSRGGLTLSRGTSAGKRDDEETRCCGKRDDRETRWWRNVTMHTQKMRRQANRHNSRYIDAWKGVGGGGGGVGGGELGVGGCDYFNSC